eukprot:1639678-Karenia_brevis.AAC.1
MSREEVAVCVWKAFDEPLDSRGPARTRTGGLVKKMVVFREEHSDGSSHYHVVVALSQPRTFGSAKRTLREREHLAAHFSLTHTQSWSAVRYGFIPTAKKPIVDKEP